MKWYTSTIHCDTITTTHTMMYNKWHTHSSYHHTHVIHTHYTQYVSSCYDHHKQAGYYSNVYTVIFKEHQFLYSNFIVCEIFILKIRIQIKLDNQITKSPSSCDISTKCKTQTLLHIQQYMWPDFGKPTELSHLVFRELPILNIPATAVPLC